MKKPRRVVAGWLTLLLGVLALIPSVSGAPISQVTAAWSAPIVHGAQPLERVPRLDMPPQNHEVFLAEDRQKGWTEAPRFAQPIPVSITPQTHGAWESQPGDMLLWRLRIHSAKALSLNFGFTGYFMPAGASLTLYTPDQAIVRGPFTAADNAEHGEFWSPIIESQEVVLQLSVPKVARRLLKLDLTSVNHGYRKFGTIDASIMSGSCNVDVVCSQGDGWRDQIASVGVLSRNGSRFCSGALINSTSATIRPFFLTANHCGVTSSNAPSLVVYWNYQNSFCRQPGSSSSGSPGDGKLTQFNSGSILRATFASSDFTVVELDDPLNPLHNLYLSGWDANRVQPSMGVGIHHPNVQEKRISFDYNPLTLETTHIRVNDWDLGTTEPGSSGSPLFNQDRRIIGQLTGGGAACGNNLSDSYGAIYRSWEGGGSPGTRLKDWLDVGGTGLMKIDGRPANSTGTTPTPSRTSTTATRTSTTGPSATRTFTTGPTATRTPTSGSTTVFFDDFETARGWVVNPNANDTATTGQWERGDPEQTSDTSGVKQLGSTVSGVNDLVSGRLAGSSIGVYDIDGGKTSTRSAAISLPSGATLTLSLSYYIAHLSNSSSEDYLRVTIVGSSSSTVLDVRGAATNRNGAWTTATANLSSFAGQSITILIEAADAGAPSLFESGVDDIRITRS